MPCRLSVSEPIGGYLNGTVSGSLSGVYTTFEFRGAPDKTTGIYTRVTPNTADDIPFDNPLLRGNGDDGYVFQTDGTFPAYRIMYLQRLANPLIPGNSVLNNPYRTIDMMPIDVTAFNSAWNGGSDNRASWKDCHTRKISPEHFQSRQRGDWNDAPDAKNFNIRSGCKGYLVPRFRTQCSRPTTSKTAPPQPRLPQPELRHADTRHIRLTSARPSARRRHRARCRRRRGHLEQSPLRSPSELFLVPTCRTSQLFMNAASDTS